MTCFCIFFLILLITAIGFASQIRQERATIQKCNNKYVTDCNAITRRIKRGEVYKTNYTVITKYPMGNNVTVKLSLYSEGISVQIVNTRFCDMKDITWLYEFFRSYSNFADKICPYPAGVLSLYNIELSPKNIPESILTIMKGKVLCKFVYEVTKTQEVIFETTLLFQCS